MVYTVVSEDFEFVSEQEWVSVPVLKELLAHMDGIKFAIEANRQAALEYFAGLRKTAPFSFDTRFPEHGTFVNLNSLDWPNKIRQMMAALQFKEPNTREGVRRNTNGQGSTQQQLPVDDVKDNIPNDVLLSFMTAIQSVRVQIGRREGVYNRAKFERDFSCTWA